MQADGLLPDEVEPITTFAELQVAIAGLPPVAPGKVRIYRGQVTDHDTIVPAGFRAPLERNAVWKFYTMLLLANVQNGLFGSDLQLADFRVLSVWLDAVSQHYGSGSRYLDVTHSVESAAWFALHKGTAWDEHTVLGPEGGPSAFDMPATIRWFEYAPSTTPGYLYAFDVDVWDGASATPPDLSLIDLSNAPAPFCTPRMIAQAGSLIQAGDKAHQDLKPMRVARTPLRIAWPMTGSDVVRRPVEQMFPLPAGDGWYRQLLRVPLAVNGDDDLQNVGLKRALPVTLYRGADAEYNRELIRTESFLHPPLLHRMLYTKAERPEGSEWWSALHVEDATPIVLEAPLLSAFSPAASPNWNHELLLEDLPDADPLNSQTGLTNVIVQFHTLEEIFWERADALTAPVELSRGIWLRRRGSELVVVFFTQTFPGTQLKPWGEITLQLNPETRRLHFCSADGTIPWTELATLPELAKPTLIALHLLRAISAVPKAEALSMLWLQNKEGDDMETTYLVRVVAGAARLVARQDAEGRSWFLLRDEQNQPYAEPKGGNAIRIVDSRSFGDIPAAIFHTALQQLQSLAPEQA